MHGTTVVGTLIKPTPRPTVPVYLAAEKHYVVSGW